MNDELNIEIIVSKSKTNEKVASYRLLHNCIVSFSITENTMMKNGAKYVINGIYVFCNWNIFAAINSIQ